MRRLKLAACVALSLLCGCTPSAEALRQNEQGTMLNVSDPRAEKQFTKGFYAIDGPGRWTGRTFSVTLKPPPNSERNGAILMLRFGIPGRSIDGLHSITLAAVVNGVATAPETYTTAGEYDYVREVPAAAFRKGAGNVDFALDKALAPDARESRELGVVVTTVGFEAK